MHSGPWQMKKPVNDTSNLPELFTTDVNQRGWHLKLKIAKVTDKPFRDAVYDEVYRLIRIRLNYI